MKDIPLLGSGFKSYSEVVSSQRRLNCIYDIRKDQDRSAVVVVGTPGSTVNLTLPTGPLRGWHTVGATLYVVSGTTLYSVSAGGFYAALGTLPTVARDVAMKDNKADLIIVDGVTGYVWDLVDETLTTITDENFPYGCTSVDFLNGAYYVENPETRQFHKSALLDGLDWSPEVFASKENSSGNLLKVSVFSGNLFLWGETDMEAWQDVGASPMPVQRVNGATQPWGLAAVNSLAEVGGTQVFLGINPDGGIKVMRMNGYTPEPVSDSDIEYLISNFPTYRDAVAMVYSAYGHSIYQLTFPSANRSFAYDLNTAVWHEAQTGLAEQSRHVAHKSITFNGRNYFCDGTTGNIYLMDEDVFTDDGEAIPREVCTRHIREGGNRLFLTRAAFDIETGKVPSGQTTPKVSLFVSRDGGRTFGNEHVTSMGDTGKYLKRVYFNRLGSGEDMVLKLRVTDPIRFVLANGMANVEVSNA